MFATSRSYTGEGGLGRFALYPDSQHFKSHKKTTTDRIFEETPRFTSITDVSGFTPIDVKQQPWCSVLQPALKRQVMYESQQIFTPADIIAHPKIPLGGAFLIPR